MTTAAAPSSILVGESPTWFLCFFLPTCAHEPTSKSLHHSRQAPQSWNPILGLKSRPNPRSFTGKVWTKLRPRTARSSDDGQNLFNTLLPRGFGFQALSCERQRSELPSEEDAPHMHSLTSQVKCAFTTRIRSLHKSRDPEGLLPKAYFICNRDPIISAESHILLEGPCKVPPFGETPTSKPWYGCPPQQLGTQEGLPACRILK